MNDDDAAPAAVTDLPEPDLHLLAERLRALAHPARLAVLKTLAQENRCVCGEIVRGLPLAQSTVSQHLKVLGEAGLIASRADGARTVYCLDRDALTRLRAEIDAVLDILTRAQTCGSTAES